MIILNKIQSKLFSILLYTLIIALPIFFVPVTRDFLIYSKFYLLAILVLTLFLISYLKFVFTKKIIWTHNPATQSLILILLSVILSIILSSPNKLQAFFNPQFGFISTLFFVLAYYFLSHFFAKIKISPVVLLALSAGATSLFTLVIMIEPFKNITLPANLTFVSNKLFNPIGTSYHFLGFLLAVLFSVVAYLLRTYRSRHSNKEQYKLISISMGVVSAFIIITLIFHTFLVVQQISAENIQFFLPPLGISWYAAVEILKNPLTALFGVGVDNFASIFTQVRTIDYNQTSLWQVNSFDVSGSAITHILTELGLLGATAYGLLIMVFFKKMNSVNIESAVFFYSTLFLLSVLPPSFITYFMFFVALAIICGDFYKKEKSDSYVINLSSLTPIYISILVICIVLTGGMVYFMGKSFMGEYYYKLSIDSVVRNNLEDLYTNQVSAIREAGYVEEFRRRFAETNILLANNIASKGEDKLTDQDKQLIGQAIQSAIAEGKTAVSLNPSKVSNWQVLAGIYRQTVNVVESAPVWTESAYQQAIVLDPRNPVLRLDLGGVYYLFKNYDQAQTMFEQAVSLKQDWSNARYNLAWVYYQKEMYAQALEQMQLVVGLIDPSKQADDYKMAQKDLDVFKKKYDEMVEENAKKEEASRPAQNQSPSRLNLPVEPEAQLEEKISLPESAPPTVPPTVTPTPTQADAPTATPTP
jgi:tetratricopeptide (TPR) repeat protein